MASPVGLLCLIATSTALCEIRFASTATDSLGVAADKAADTPPTALLATVEQQLDEYFAGTRVGFDFPMAPVGTPFQQRVWAELRALPYGSTTTYSALARKLGDALAVRAVGGANAANPLAIVVPCHRVIGTGGKLTGFVGGTAVKQWLLRHEARHTAPAAGNLFATNAQTVPFGSY